MSKILAEHSACPTNVCEHLEQSGYHPQTALTVLTDRNEDLRNIAHAASDGPIVIGNIRSPEGFLEVPVDFYQRSPRTGWNPSFERDIKWIN